MTLLDNNLALINKRWPKLYNELIQVDLSHLDVSSEQNTLVLNGIQLTSNIDRVFEADLQCSLIPLSSKTAFIYGPALGDTALELLSRPTIEKLHVVVLSKGVFLHSLNAICHKSWLSDARVTLHFVSSINDVYSPFLVNPAEIRLADDNSAQLRDRLELELNHAYIEKRHTVDDKVVKGILDNLAVFKLDADIAELRNSHGKKASNKTIFVAGAGPSLEDHYDYLKANHPFIIATDASVKSLLSQGIKPAIVVAIDALSNKLFSPASFEALAKTPLVYFPSTASQLIEQWQGPRFASYSNTKMFNCLKGALKDDEHKTPLFNAGSVIHPAIDLAYYLNAEEIILLGADFSFTKNKSHANSNSSTNSLIPLEQATHWVLNSRNEKVATLANFKGYLRDLERYIAQHNDTVFLNGSDLGAKIEGAPVWQKHL